MLYTPIRFRNLEIKNRWVMSPMCMYSCENGVPNDFHFVHYASRAQGGTGLIIVEATGVVPEGRITNKCTGIWSDEQKTAFSKIVKFIHANTESKIGIPSICFSFGSDFGFSCALMKFNEKRKAVAAKIRFINLIVPN